jgi:hypothetical protein
MKLKICCSCKKSKKYSEYYKRRDRNSVQSICKECKKDLEQLRYRKNRKYILKRNEIYRIKNKKKVAFIRRNYYKKRYASDLNFRLSERIRKRIRDAVHNNRKIGSAVNDLGCSINFFKDYIENKFKKGMSWTNYGEWHLDHIKPLANFDLSVKKEFLLAVHYSNYQPLWKIENLKKGAKYG